MGSVDAVDAPPDCSGAREATRSPLRRGGAEATRYDKTSPYQPIMRRNGKLFATGFRDPAQPDEVAKTILAAITSDEYRLRWPVGKDAVGFARGRPGISDEDWVAMGDDLSDQEYNRRFFEYFGIRL